VTLITVSGVSVAAIVWIILSDQYPHAENGMGRQVDHKAIRGVDSGPRSAVIDREQQGPVAPDVGVLRRESPARHLPEVQPWEGAIVEWRRVSEDEFRRQWIEEVERRRRLGIPLAHGLNPPK